MPVAEKIPPFIVFPGDRFGAASKGAATLFRLLDATVPIDVRDPRQVGIMDDQKIYGLIWGSTGWNMRNAFGNLARL